MTLDDFVHRVRDNSGGEFTLPTARLAIDTVIETLKDDVMIPGDFIQFKSFGTFGAKIRKGHIGRNPGTGKEVKIKDHMIPYFNASKSLKEDVRGK